MPPIRRWTWLTLIACVLLPPASATASGGSRGGTVAPVDPQPADLTCVPTKKTACPDAASAVPGARVKVVGEDLSAVRAIVFRGARGPQDDVMARATHVRDDHFEARVPRRARSGRVVVIATMAKAALPRTVRVHAVPMAVKALPAVDAGAEGHVFPIQGEHDLGQSETNNFGGGRNHQGQDMFAACGTPLVAAQGGRVKFAGTHANAGNYVVITGELTGMDYVYMHMRREPSVTKDDVVSTGQPLGEVGDSGNASGCHLHFELWQAPGWYSGGKAIDPLPRLRSWRGT